MHDYAYYVDAEASWLCVKYLLLRIWRRKICEIRSDSRAALVFVYEWMGWCSNVNCLVNAI